MGAVPLRFVTLIGQVMWVIGAATARTRAVRRCDAEALAAITRMFVWAASRNSNAFNRRVDEPPAATVGGSNVAVTPVGSRAAENVTVSAVPATTLVEIAKLAVRPAPTRATRLSRAAAKSLAITTAVAEPVWTCSTVYQKVQSSAASTERLL